MTILSELETELKRLQERKAQSGVPPLDAVPPAAPALSTRPRPRLGPTQAPVSSEPQYKPTDLVGAGLRVATNLLTGGRVKAKDYPAAYGAGAGGLVTNLGKGMGIAGRELQQMSEDESPVRYAMDKAYKVMQYINPAAVAPSNINQKGVAATREVKDVVPTAGMTPLDNEARKPKYKLITSLGEKLESAEKPTMALGERTKAFYEDLLSDGAKELKNSPWYKADGLGAKFISAALQATESMPMMAVTAVAGAPIAATLKTTGATSALAAGIQRLGVNKKWAGKVATWLSEGLAYSTPEGVLAGLSNAEEVGKAITAKPHDELVSSPKYLEYYNSTPKNLDPAEREGIAKQLLIEDAEVFALSATCAASMATGMAAGGGLFGSAGASSSFIMRRVMGFAKEGVQEFFQSGPGEKLPANIALKLFADPDQEIMQGVWAAALAGAGPGALMGGFVGSGVKQTSPGEVIEKARAAKVKLRETSMRTLTRNKVSDADLVQMMQSPEALAAYGLEVSDLKGMLVNKDRAQAELVSFQESLAAAPSDAVRQGMKSSFLGEAMEKLQTQIQPEKPDDGQKEKPEAGQKAEKTAKKDQKSRAEATIAIAQQRVVDVLSKRPTLNLLDPEIAKTFDAELKKAYEDLGLAQEQADAGALKERRTDLKTRKRIDDMTPGEMKKELMISAVTGLSNKRALDETLQKAKDEGVPTAAVFIDADGLKTINDLGGHEAGDIVLHALAEAIRGVDPDLGFHVSGDEFVILADNVKQAEAKAAKFEKILATKEIIFTLENGDEYTYSGLGASYGVAETVKEADIRMGVHKAAREKEGKRVGRGETPPGLRKTASGEGKGSVGSGQEAGVLEQGKKEVTLPEAKQLEADQKVWKKITSKTGVLNIPAAQRQVRLGFLKATGLSSTLSLKQMFDPEIVGEDIAKVFTNYTDQISITGTKGQPIPKKMGEILAQVYNAGKKKIVEGKKKKVAAAPKKAEKKKVTVAQKKEIAAKQIAEDKARKKAQKEEEERKAAMTPEARMDLEVQIASLLQDIKTVKRQITDLEKRDRVKTFRVAYKNLKAELQRYIDQVNKLAPGTVPEASDPQNLTPEQEFERVLKSTKSAKVVLKWMAKHSDNPFFRKVATRMLFHLPKVNLVIVDTEKPIPPNIPMTIHHSKGLHQLKNNVSTVFLKDLGLLNENSGMNELVFLHETVHAATVAKIRRSSHIDLAGSELAKTVAKLRKLQRVVEAALKKPNVNTKTLLQNREWSRRIKNVREFVAYGLSDSGFQKMLHEIPYENTTAWGRFVKAIAKLLGITDHTALGEFLQLTDDIIAADRPGEDADTFKGLADLAVTFESANASVDMMKEDDLSPDQKKLFEKAFSSLVKRPPEIMAQQIQEEEQGVLKAAAKSRDPATRELSKKLTALNRASTEFKRTEKTQTITWLDRVLGLPEYSFAKDEAANRVLQTALAADEVKYNLQTNITGAFGKTGEDIKANNPKAYETAGEYVRDVDKSGVGFSIAQVEGEWNVVGLAGEALKLGLTEGAAAEAMIQAEQAHLKQQDYDPEAIELIKEFRYLTNRAFDTQVADLRQQLATSKRYGLEEPRIAGEGSPTISEAIATIGDLRGSYFPRERPNKTYIVRASKKGADNVLLTYDGFFPENTESWDITNRIKQVINTGLPISKEIKDLQAQGYEVTGPTLSPAPSDAVFDAPGLAASLDAFLSLAETSSKDEDSKAIQHLNQMLVKKIAELYKAKGSLSSRLTRVQDYTVGFETDMMKAGLSHAQRVASGVTKRVTARDMILNFTGRDISFSEYVKINPGKKYLDYRKFVAERRVDPTKQQALYKVVKDYIQYTLKSNTAEDRALGYMKAVAVFMYLGFRVPSAAVNLTNMVMAVPATISAHTGLSIPEAFKHISHASAVYATYRSNKLIHHGVSETAVRNVARQAETLAKGVGKTITEKVQLTAEETMVLDDIATRGWDQAHFNIEALKALQGYSGQTFNNVMAASMYMFGAAERANRAVTILAAYQAFKSTNPEMGHEALMTKAHHTSDRAHGIYGKAAKPLLVQRYKKLDLFYTFLKFQHNYMLDMLEVGIKYKNIQASLHMLLIPAVLSGMGATLATPVIAALLKIFGYSDDPEEDMYAWTEEHLPTIMQNMVRHGAFGFLNVNFKGSLQMTNPFPTKLKEVIGAPGAVGFDVWDAAKHFRHREWSKGAEKALPTFLETPLKGYRFYTEGVTTKTYSPVFYGEDQLKADELELFMMAFSFNTARLSGIREKQWKEKNVQGSFSKDRQNILRRLKKIKMSSDPENIKALARIQEEIDDFNLRVETAPARYKVNYLTWTQLNRSLRQAMKPSKFEKQRAERVD